MAITKKIGVLYICTGAYAYFWPEFFTTAEEYLLPTHEKHYFVFTDYPNLLPTNERVHVIPQQKLGWPFDSLMRFDMFLSQAKALKKMQYLFFFNANMRFVNPVRDEIFPPRKNQLVVVQHHGFANTPLAECTFERNSASTAYVAFGKEKVYVSGSVNGGTQKTFLSFCKSASRATHRDLKKGIIAVWHDESHLNKYILTHPYYLLSPSYAYFEQLLSPYAKKIILIEKKKFGGTSLLREQATPTQVGKVQLTYTSLYGIVNRMVWQHRKCKQWLRQKFEKQKEVP